MDKINLLTEDYGEIIKQAYAKGFKTKETDPGKILDRASDFLHSRGIGYYPNCSNIPSDVRRLLGL